MIRLLRLVPVLLLVVLAGACAAGTGGSTGSSANALTAEDLETVQTLSVYDAIQRLRPRWLQSRSTSSPPQVVMNGAPYGGMETLRSIQVSDVTSIRYRDGRDATTRYGTGYGGGVIEVSSRTP